MKSKVSSLVAVLVFASAAHGKEVVLPGRVVSVTLFADQALVTRRIVVDAPAGTVELVVPNLPRGAIAGSLFANGGEGVQIRAVRVRERTHDAPDERMDEANEELRGLEVERKRIRLEQAMLNRRSAYLQRLEGRLTQSHGNLDLSEIKGVSEFTYEEQARCLSEGLELEGRLRKLSARWSLADAKLRQLLRGKSSRDGVVFFQKSVAGQVEIELSYSVNRTGWSAYYTVHGKTGSEHVDLELSGIVHQQSGEDWNEVRLTLSTASPSLSSNGPSLAPLRIALTKEQAEGAEDSASLEAKLVSIRRRQQVALRRLRGSQHIADGRRFSWEMNQVASDLQLLELLTKGEDLKARLDSTAQTEQQAAVSYLVPYAVTLASRPEPETVRVASWTPKSSYYYVATPLLTSRVFLEAELTHEGSASLPPGPLNVYLDGRFSGRSELPTVGGGQTFVVGFGASLQLRTRRELVSRVDEIQGGNRQIKCEYRLVVESFHDTPVRVRLRDRVPAPDGSSDIRVRILKMETPLSDDIDYLRGERGRGIFRWDLTVPAAAHGKKAAVVNYGYSLEFDRELSLFDLVRTRALALRREFDAAMPVGK